ncbi:hypothetical protein [Metabacillus halosaccharovorans]|uniref:Uncharacterized protein n=1 Tax=Metabacillus halosaccharovorans TaxID=930124 RepID=A0ABT3DCD2_9BACI|nr:hypothetical protein [Metabacillus halosaccharovorans]MCV9884728.1 hypothetical protein [Metabacillus halosaccharovorans]
MATVKIELELDWLNEDESLDESIKSEVIANLQNRLIKNAENQISNKLNAQLEEIADRVSSSFIEKTLESKIEDLQIPHKSGGYWSSEIEYIPISQYIGMKYEEHLTKKSLDEYGREAKYSSDAKLSISEYFIKNYLAKELTGKVSAMIQTARKDAEETIVKALENNLKEQLSVDIIQRLNIPQMLESLQNKAAELDTTK